MGHGAGEMAQLLFHRAWVQFQVPMTGDERPPAAPPEIYQSPLISASPCIHMHISPQTHSYEWLKNKNNCFKHECDQREKA